MPSSQDQEVETPLKPVSSPGQGSGDATETSQLLSQGDGRLWGLSSFDVHDRDIFKGKKLSHSFQTLDNKGELKTPRFNTQQERCGQKGRCWDTGWVFSACLGYTGMPERQKQNTFQSFSMKNWPLISYLKTNLICFCHVFLTIIWSIIFTILGSDVVRQADTFSDRYTHAEAGTLDQPFGYFLSPLSLKWG